MWTFLSGCKRRPKGSPSPAQPLPKTNCESGRSPVEENAPSSLPSLSLSRSHKICAKWMLSDLTRVILFVATTAQVPRHLCPHVDVTPDQRDIHDSGGTEQRQLLASPLGYVHLQATGTTWPWRRSGGVPCLCRSCLAMAACSCFWTSAVAFIPGEVLPSPLSRQTEAKRRGRKGMLARGALVVYGQN